MGEDPECLTGEENECLAYYPFANSRGYLEFVYYGKFGRFWINLTDFGNRMPSISELDQWIGGNHADPGLGYLRT